MSLISEPLRPHNDTMIGDEDAPDMLDKIRFMRAGLSTRRYHQRYTAEIDTVGKHSAGVAGFLLLMYAPTVPSASLLAAAIVHDWPEAVTGDIPSPAKRACSFKVKRALAAQEEHLLSRHVFDYKLNETEERQLKMADVFDGMMFCIEERNRGNREVDAVGDTYKQYMYEIKYHNTVETDIASTLISLWEGERK